MVILDMVSEFLAAICMEHFKTPKVLRSLDTSLGVYSLPQIRHAILSFLFSNGISIKNENLIINGRFEISQIFRQEELNSFKKRKK